MVCARNLGALAAAFLCLYVLVIFAEPHRQSDAIALEWKQITVRVLDGGPTFSLMIEPAQTGWDLMRDISELEGIPFAHMITKIDDTEMDFSKQLSHYNISDQTLVTLWMPNHLSNRLEKFNVRTLHGKDLLVTTELGNLVASLKNNTTQWTGIAQAQLRLLLNGRELRDERKLAYYDIEPRTRLNLGPTLEDCRHVVTISVKTLSGATIKIETSLADTVTDLKEKIWAKTGIPAGVQRLSGKERMIAGEDRLCDLELGAGPTVYMFLYSSLVTSLDQIASLREPPVNRSFQPYKAPIFHEAQDVAESVQSDHRPASLLYKDARNWIAQSGHRPGWSRELFNPVAHLYPNPDDQGSIEEYRDYLEVAKRPGAGEWYRREAAMNRAQIKFSLAVRSYRVAAKLNSFGHYIRLAGITLGGGSIDVSPPQPVPLGADVNNWAPDALSDSDVARLFEVSERVRRVLARDEQTGEGTLSVDSQRRINRAILQTYLEALAGCRPPVEYEHASEDEQCGICIDDLTAEPAIQLACGHVIHADCTLSWAADIIQSERVPSCPFCRQPFMLPCESLGRAELNLPAIESSENVSKCEGSWLDNVNDNTDPWVCH